MKQLTSNSAHSRHALHYHLVWCVKYRRSVLITEIGDRIKEIIIQIAAEQNCIITAIETDVDHVHILLELKPTHSIPKLVQLFKGRSARLIFQEFPFIKNRLWGGHLWSPSYYIASVGGAPLQTIKRYVESQREK
ncbi:MAG TPA: IS200/IS605 family transposase [Pyrinomonadaceae bacterium]|jgi:putative transposase